MKKEEILKNRVKIILAHKNGPDYFNDKEKDLMIKNYKENRKDKLSVPEEPTFWATFVFKGTSPGDLHCTHKFFGEMEDSSVKSILSTLDKYFSKNPFKTFKTVFNKEEFFGQDKNIRVITPVFINKSNFLVDLRDKLQKYKPDDYPEYLPHVTTETINKLDLPIVGYAFLFGNTTLRLYEE